MQSNCNFLDIINLIEIINYHGEHPVSINNATKKILENIPFLNDEHIENIIYYLYLYGDMKSVTELSYVPSIDMRTFLLIKSFFFIEEGYEHINDKVVNKMLIMPKSNLIITIK